MGCGIKGEWAYYRGGQIPQAGLGTSDVRVTGFGYVGGAVSKYIDQDLRPEDARSILHTLPRQNKVDRKSACIGRRLCAHQLVSIYLRDCGANSSDLEKKNSLRIRR